MIRDKECDRIEAEISELFREIRKVASPDKTSLEDAIEKAMEEGKRFKEWQESNRPLGNLSLVQNIEDDLLPAGKFRFVRFPVLRLFRKKVSAAGQNLSQLEIWNCDRKNKPIFPLARIDSSDIAENRRLRIVEPLRNDLRLNLEIWRKESSVFIRAGVNNPNSMLSRIAGSMNRLNEAGAGAVEYWQKMARSFVMEGALPLLLIVLSLVVIPAAMRSNRDTGQAGENKYSRSNAGPNEDEILGQKCFKQMCGDPKYLSDTDTVNGA